MSVPWNSFVPRFGARLMPKPPVATFAPAPAVAPTNQLVPLDPPAAEAAPPIAASEPVEAKTVPEAAAPEEKPAPAKEAQPESKPDDDPAAKPAAAKGGDYAVQLGSFDGPQRKEKAQSLQKRIKKELGLSAQIIDSEKEKICRVVLTGYKDKAAASAASSGIRKKSGFSGAFVRAM